MALTATLTLSSAELEHPALWDLHVALHNDCTATVRLSTATMLGSVCFEVQDCEGAAVPLGPPPVPPSDLSAGMVTIGPGSSQPLLFHGDELFADAPPPGRYRLRFAGNAPAVDDAWSGSIESPWVEFEVR